MILVALACTFSRIFLSFSIYPIQLTVICSDDGQMQLTVICSDDGQMWWTSDIASNLSRLTSHWTKESIHQKCQQVHVVHVQFEKKSLLPLNNTCFLQFFLVNPDWKYYQDITWKDDHLTSPCYDFIKPSNFFEGPRHWVKPKRCVSINFLGKGSKLGWRSLSVVWLVTCKAWLQSPCFYGQSSSWSYSR